MRAETPVPPEASALCDGLPDARQQILSRNIVTNRLMLAEASRSGEIFTRAAFRPPDLDTILTLAEHGKVRPRLPNGARARGTFAQQVRDASCVGQ